MMRPLSYIGVVSVLLCLLSEAQCNPLEKKYRQKRRVLDGNPGERFYGFYDERGLAYSSLKSLTPSEDPYEAYEYHPNNKPTSKPISDDSKQVIVRMGYKDEPTLQRQKRKNTQQQENLEKWISEVYGKDLPYNVFDGDFVTYKQHHADTLPSVNQEQPLNDQEKFSTDKEMHSEKKFNSDKKLDSDQKFESDKKFGNDKKSDSSANNKKFNSDKKFDNDKKSDSQTKFNSDKKFDNDKKSDSQTKFNGDKEFDNEKKFNGDKKFNSDKKSNSEFDKDKKFNSDKKFDNDKKLDNQMKFNSDKKFDNDKKLDNQMKFNTDKKAQFNSDKKFDNDKKLDNQMKFNGDKEFDNDEELDNQMKFNTDKKAQFNSDKKFDNDKKLDNQMKFNTDKKAQFNSDKKFDNDKESDSQTKFNGDKEFENDKELDNQMKFNTDKKAQFNSDKKFNNDKKLDNQMKFNGDKKFENDKELDNQMKFNNDKKAQFNSDKKFNNDKKLDNQMKFNTDKKAQFNSDKKLDDDKKLDNQMKFNGDKKFENAESFGNDKKFNSDKKFDNSEKFNRDKKFNSNQKFDNDKKLDSGMNFNSDKKVDTDKDDQKFNNDKKMTYKDTWKSYKKGEMQGDMPMDPYRTPFDSQTSPNPPTTKPTKVTPMASNKKLPPMIDGHILSLPEESCYDDEDCSVGRVCLQGTCVCGDDSLCEGHKKPVCGSDGHLYNSHCELHRQACVQGQHIRIDHNAGCASKAKQTTGTVNTQPKQIQGTMCEYSVKEGVEGVLWGQQALSSKKTTMEDCRESCDTEQLTGKCVAFEYSSTTQACTLYDNKDDVIFWPNAQMVYYEQTRCKKQIDPRCEVDELRVSSEQVFAVCNIRTSLDKTLEECKVACSNCAAFTYVPENGECEIHDNKACQNMLDEQGRAHYVQKCGRSGSDCEYIEIIPGKAPFMCSTASQKVASVVECHDACVKSGCQAFKYKMDNSESCDLYFDRSCITMLNKRKENYYVRRCSKPEDCEYEEVLADSSNQPCNIMSSSTDTFDECHSACGDCSGFKFDYQTGQCSLYDRESCLPDKKYNFYIVRCPTSTQTSVPVVQSKPGAATLPLDISDSLVLKSDKTGESEVDPVPRQNNNVILAPPKIMRKPKTSDQDKNSPAGEVLDPASKEEVEKTILGERPIIEAGEKECTLEKYQKFKAQLLRCHCVRFGEKDCDKEQITNKEYIATLMFSFYDRDRGGSVETKELWESQVINKFNKISNSCSLVDIMMYDDSGDGVLYKREFIDAFDMPDYITQQRVEVIPILATAGNGLEIQCAVHPDSETQLVWQRHGVDMALVSFPDIAVFSDGTLYFDTVGVHHTGNYTCFDRSCPGYKQVHNLVVHMKPEVTVSPNSILMESDHIDIFIHCHASGIPSPKISWQLNGKPLPVSPNHYIKEHGTLRIYNTDAKRDTGEYKCVAENTAGKAEAITRVLINPKDLSQKQETETIVKESYFVFHKNGYNVYNPDRCNIERMVSSSFGNLKYIPEELDHAPSLCEHQKPCVWGEGVAVKDKYVYVAQPYQNRVVVIDSAHTQNPVQFVRTDEFPVKLFYVEHLDEVWVLCWKKDRNTGSKTIVVIRDASKDNRHHMVHTQPIGYRFDLVQDIFLPPQNDLGHAFHYGYVLHNEQQGLFKLDLVTMRYTKAVDLSAFKCVPESVAFIPIGGYVVVKCIEKMIDNSRTLQIVMDHVTDAALSNTTMYGTPYVSPDSKTLVTVDEVDGKVTVAKISDDGKLYPTRTIKIGSSVSDVSFYHSDTTAGYNLFLASQARAEVYHLNLENGKITVIRDADAPRQVKLWPWSSSKRAMVNGDFFSNFVASPSQSSLVIFSGQEKKVHCKFPRLEGPDTVIFSTSKIG